MKKIIITITLMSFLNLIGCYYQEQMNPRDYNFDESGAIKIVTKDSIYNLKGREYHLENDTLYATLKEKLDAQTTLRTNVEIPVIDIDSLEVVRTDAGMTTLAVLGSIIGAAGIIAIIAAATYDGGGSGTKCGPPSGPSGTKHGI